MQAQLLKDKNLWPSKNDESWKYFDLKSYERLLSDSRFIHTKSEIKYVSDLQSEIQIGGTEVLIAENLKGKLEAKFVSKLEILNQQSNLDLRLTGLNLMGEVLNIEVKNQDNLNLKISYFSGSSLENLNTALRVCLENSKVSWLEQDLTSQGSGFSSHVQVLLKDSTLEHVLIFGNPSKMTKAAIYNLEVAVGENSSYKNTTLTLNNKLLRMQQSVSLNTKSAVGHLNAFNISEAQNFSELRTEVLHLQPKTESRQLFKTIAADQSQSVFNGRIYVNSVAQKTDASQLCQGILLNPKAEINAKPELEIYADDVKAAHGAAIGQLGKDQVFYLISRGIKPEIAYKMLSKAFAGEVLAAIENLEHRNQCQSIMDESSSAVFEKLAASIHAVEK